ncbi:hypothetical protein ABZY68_03150 [Streptomyces sp. NPDC006482]|uniref:hypothetical protein n=1 Tax=Streptomyces sp. NPDC006482 TaxID=3154306 RepID=UPI0033B74DF7
MSAPHERSALAPSLFAYARDLRRAETGGPLPEGGHPLPDSARPPRPRRVGRDHHEARTAVTDVLLSLLADPDGQRAVAEAHRAIAATGVRDRTVFAAAAALPPPDDPTDRARARALGRCLTRDGTTTVSVAAGLGLLARLGEPEDVPYLRTLGVLQGLHREVVTALTPLDRRTAAFVGLIHRVRGDELRALVGALAAEDAEAVRDRFLEIPTGPRCLGPELARQVAEAVGLAGLLRRDPDRPGLLAQAVRMLVRMTGLRGYEAEILRYEEAVALYETAAAHAHRLPRDLDHRAALVSLALDLHSGAGHLLAWAEGRREELFDTLLAVVGDPDDPPTATPTDQAARRRADWIRRTVRQLRTAHRFSTDRREGPVGTPRLRIEVAVADPAEPDVVETRFLIDGRPLVPEAFGRGPGDTPERLLDGGGLRAAPEPRDVRLAEAYCTEGCCGALYVTVRREGAHVVWDGWRRPRALSGLPELPAYRFDAVAYDAEIARAETDQGWTWPARRTARLIAAGLRDRPERLTRWGLRQGWIATEFDAPDTTVVTFTGPPLTTEGTPEREGEPRQFLWRVPDDGTPPEEQAAAALRRLAEGDPRGYPELRG